MIIYYITKYLLTTPFFKLLVLITFSFILKSGFEYSTFVDCMNDPSNNLDVLQETERNVTFHISDELNHINDLREIINVQNDMIADLERDARRYRYAIRALQRELIAERNILNHLIMNLESSGFEINYR